MRRRSAPTHRSDAGFTLVELLVVIVVLGVLATVTVFAVRGITDQGQSAACDTDLGTLATAQEVHYARTRSFADEATLVSSGAIRSESQGYDVTGDASGFSVVPSAGSACTQSRNGSASTTAAPTALAPTETAATSGVSADSTTGRLNGVTSWRYPLGNLGSENDQFLVLGRANAWADWNAAIGNNIATTRRTHFVDMDGLTTGQIDTMMSAMASTGSTTIIVYTDDDTGTLAGTGGSVAAYVGAEAPSYALTTWTSATLNDGTLSGLLASN